MNDLQTAVGLLTILPLRGSGEVSARAFAYYPLVGLALGAVLTLASVLLRLALPNLLAAALTVAGWVVLTGALHLDGFSDACDGLFVATTRERRLEILRDVHAGAFGVAGLALLLIVKVAAVASAGNAAILLAPVLGRWAVVYAAAYPPARSEGMAVVFRAGLTRRILVAATALAALCCAALGGFGLAAFVVSFGVATGIARLALSRLGGLTGDIYGMVCESVEVAVLIAGAVG